MAEEIINRVAKSPLVTIDLGDLYQPGKRVLIDLKNNLENGFLLREKDFREFVKEHDWSQYQGQFIAITCSADAIVPNWAYMLLATRLSPHAKKIVFGSLQDLEIELFNDALNTIDPVEYQDKKVVVKGCGDIEIPPSAYLEISNKLTPYVSTLMYGEPCSTVPIYKRKK